METIISEWNKLRLCTDGHIIGQEIIRGEVMQQTSVCPRCGAYNNLGQRFCVGCGAPLIMQCPYCGTNTSPTSKFCTNCGMQFSQNAQQPIPTEERKGKSGWAKFGLALFIIGILCLVVGIPSVLIMNSIDSSTEEAIPVTLIIRCAIAGIFNIAVGLPLMRRG